MPTYVCKPGCNCRRHRYSGRNRQRGNQCIIIENGVRCIDPVRNVIRGLCGKHYARLQRAGYSTVDISKKKTGHEADLSCENPCICGDSIVKHRNGKFECKVHGCPCREFDPTNKKIYEEASKKLSKLGFRRHIHTHAYCLGCERVLQIGTWADPHTIKRARLHAGRDCTGLRRKSMTA